MALKDLMARASGPEPPRAETATPAAPRPAAPSPAAVTHLGASSVFSGQLRCGESLRIDGQLRGEVSCDQTLTVGESGSVQAAIEGDTVVIAGEVQGDITARRKITLERTARVTGDLCTPGIVIQEGAKLEGRIVIGGEVRPGAETSAGARAPAPAAEAKPAARATTAAPAPPGRSAPPPGA
jgi:cytoskeletal protein CcmA (bactofilin family)